MIGSMSTASGPPHQSRRSLLGGVEYDVTYDSVVSHSTTSDTVPQLVDDLSNKVFTCGSDAASETASAVVNSVIAVCQQGEQENADSLAAVPSPTQLDGNSDLKAVRTGANSDAVGANAAGSTVSGAMPLSGSGIAGVAEALPAHQDGSGVSASLGGTGSSSSSCPPCGVYETSTVDQDAGGDAGSSPLDAATAGFAGVVCSGVVCSWQNYRVYSECVTSLRSEQGRFSHAHNSTCWPTSALHQGTWHCAMTPM